MPHLRRLYFPPVAILALLLSATVAPLQAQDSSNALNESDFNESARRGNEAREAGRTDDALRNYSVAVKINPNWQEGWWSIGSLEYERDHYTEAASAFRNLATLAPQASPAWTFLGLSTSMPIESQKSWHKMKKTWIEGIGVPQHHKTRMLLISSM